MTVTGLVAVRFGVGMREPVMTMSFVFVGGLGRFGRAGLRLVVPCAKAGVAKLAAPQISWCPASC